MKVTLHKGGTAQKTVELNHLQIPDCWHVFIQLKREGRITEAEMVLDCWHIAHDLKRTLAEIESD